MRSGLNETSSGKDGVSARMMRSISLPFLMALQSELRDEVVPSDVLEGVATLRRLTCP